MEIVSISEIPNYNVRSDTLMSPAMESEVRMAEENCGRRCS